MSGYKETILKILLPFFLIGVLIRMTAWNLKQGAYIEQLEQDLSETREQLYIANDNLKQIQMHNEREYYMDQMEDEADE